jgi:hypothetical protein
MPPTPGFHLDLAPLIDCRPQRKAVTSDLVVRTFTKKRKGGPAPMARACHDASTNVPFSLPANRLIVSVP